MPILGPNTAADNALLAPAVIVCAGEDAGELRRAFPAEPAEFFEYRCYRFWRFAKVMVVWTGIGTGCLEPMLWEMLSPNIVERIILIGSAGRLPGSRVPIGEVRCIAAAYSGGTSLDAHLAGEPTRPRWLLPSNADSATIVSTDYYYGFSPRALAGEYPAAGTELRSAVDRYFPSCNLVDMESAQFYHFCDRFDRTGRLHYLAIKGASNDIDAQLSQLEISGPLLEKCFRRAWKLVGE